MKPPHKDPEGCPIAAGAEIAQAGDSVLSVIHKPGQSHLYWTIRRQRLSRQHRSPLQRIAEVCECVEGRWCAGGQSIRMSAVGGGNRVSEMQGQRAGSTINNHCKPGQEAMYKWVGAQRSGGKWRCQDAKTIAPDDSKRIVGSPCSKCEHTSQQRVMRGKRRLAIGTHRSTILLYGEVCPDESTIINLFEQGPLEEVDAAVIAGTRLQVPTARNLLVIFARASSEGTVLYCVCEQGSSRNRSGL